MNVPLPPAPRRTSGWVIFAGVVTAVAGAANIIYGLTLLLNDEWVAISPDAIVTFDLTTVGWIYLLFGALQLVVSMAIFNGDLWARIVGVVGASFNMLAQFAFLSVYPQWSWVVIIIDGLIIYGLTVHGDEVAEL